MYFLFPARRCHNGGTSNTCLCLGGVTISNPHYKHMSHGQLTCVTRKLFCFTKRYVNLPRWKICNFFIFGNDVGLICQQCHLLSLPGHESQATILCQFKNNAIPPLQQICIFFQSHMTTFQQCMSIAHDSQACSAYGITRPNHPSLTIQAIQHICGQV